MIRQIEIEELIRKPKSYKIEEDFEGYTFQTHYYGARVYVIKTQEKLKDYESIYFYDKNGVKHELYEILQYKPKKKKLPQDVKILECKNWAQNYSETNYQENDETINTHV
jgi:hypothetical protein